MGKRVVSFSLWGKDPMYGEGAVANAQMCRELYRGWEVWVALATDNPPEPSVVERLRALGARVYDAGAQPEKYGMLWRAEAAWEPEVERIVIRDCDSRPSTRETCAVEAWAHSGKPVHIMRDHKNHTAPIMGGMWGAVVAQLPSGVRDSFRSHVHAIAAGLPLPQAHRGRYVEGSDQAWLAASVWPLVKGCACIHDDWGRFEGAQDWPCARKGKGFVGQQLHADGKAIWPK
jgi:hypothetical protein